MAKRQIGRKAYSYNGYAKLEKEDPEYKKHRRALFLINKKLVPVEDRLIIRGSTTSKFRRRPCKLKIKIGENRVLRRLRKCICICRGNYVPIVGICRHFVNNFKSLGSWFHGAGATAVGHRPEPVFVSVA